MLPALKPMPLDQVIIDGDHAVPTPLIDFYYTSDWLVKDVFCAHLPSCTCCRTSRHLFCLGCASGEAEDLALGCLGITCVRNTCHRNDWSDYLPYENLAVPTTVGAPMVWNHWFEPCLSRVDYRSHYFVDEH